MEEARVWQEGMEAPEGACLLPLSRGHLALIDRDDEQAVRELNWVYALPVRSPKGYAVHNYRTADGKFAAVSLGRWLLGMHPELEVDYINLNPLDCRRENLRLVTHQQNRENLPLQKNSTTGARGVYWDTKTQKYRAEMRVKGVKFYLGRFGSIEEARQAAEEGRRRFMTCAPECRVTTPGL